MKRAAIISIILSIFIEATIVKTVNASMVDYIVGSDRYETSALLADRLNYETVILVNGNCMADGLSASGLSGATNSPIIFTESNNIPKSVEERLTTVKRAYIVGGESVISSNIKKNLSRKGIKVKRLGGEDRYETSIKVANEIEKIKGIQEIYYVNGAKTYADAVSIAPVASRSSNPIILTDGIKTDFFVSEAKAYTIGGRGIMGDSFDKFSERIGGKDRFETNKIIINKFFENKDHVYLSSAEVFADALSASFNKEPIVLANDYSNKTVLEGVNSITALGGVNKRAVAQAKSYIYGEKVVFYIQHQDDETIFASSAIIDAINCRGKENVYVVLVTDGTDSIRLREPRYACLTEDEKSSIRDNEFMAACSKLGVDTNNIVFLNEREADWNSESLKNKVLEFESKFESVTHVGHTYKYDVQAQHLENGKAILQLYKDGAIKDCRFFARNPELMKGMDFKYYIESIADDTDEEKKVRNAAFEYSIDNRDMKREGIGYKSVSNLFNILTSSSHMQSYLHEPEL